MKKIRLFSFIIAMFLTTSLMANPSLGEDLEKQMWEDIKNRNWRNIEDNISFEFQSVHPDGGRNRAQELSLIKKLGVESYSISHIVTTEDRDTIVVTYLISVAETIDSERLSSMFTPRLSVWQKNNGKWQWIAHANLNPFKDAIQ